MENSPLILVNATAAIESGALTILNQFLRSAVARSDKYQFIVFTSDNASFPDYSPISLVPIAKNGNLGRLHWDYSGFRRWVAARKLKPALIISFQNTGLRFDKKVPQLIYYHHSAPFSSARWKITNSAERVFWFYKNIYPLFTKVLLTAKTRFVVQTKWMKEGLMRKFSLPDNRVMVIRPEVAINLENITLPLPDKNGETWVFYPAMPYVNKNHIILIKAVAYLVKSKKILASNRIKIIFTCDFEKDRWFTREIIDQGLQDYFIFSGKLSPEDMKVFYKNSDLMVFPSVLETFGLPLLEAATLGIPVLASDLEYARETLKGYAGARFIPPYNEIAWADAIREAAEKKERFTPMVLTGGQSWSDFFSFVHSIITEN